MPKQAETLSAVKAFWLTVLVPPLGTAIYIIFAQLLYALTDETSPLRVLGKFGNLLAAYLGIVFVYMGMVIMLPVVEFLKRKGLNNIAWYLLGALITTAVCCAVWWPIFWFLQFANKGILPFVPFAMWGLCCGLAAWIIAELNITLMPKGRRLFRKNAAE